MKPMYFNSVGSMSNHAQNYPVDSFTIQSQPRQCGCGQIRIGYEVTDKQDNDIMDILILCPLCANQPKNKQ